MPKRPPKLLAGEHDIELIDPRTLIPHPQNARRGDYHEIRRLMEANGVYGVAVVQRSTRHICKGNHTVRAALLDPPMPLVRVEWVDVDDAHAARLAIGDNRASDLATWDLDVLRRQLGELPTLEGTGFNQADLDKLLEGTAGDASPGRTDPDDLPDPPAKPTTKLGDLWEVGPHRLMCGDSSNPAHVEALMAGARADLLFTSPPYNTAVGYDGHNDDEVPWPRYQAFLVGVMTATLPAVAPGRAVCWQIGVSPQVHPHRQAVMLEDDLGLTPVRQFIWRKAGVPVPMWHMTEKERRARRLFPNYVHELVLLYATPPGVEPPPPAALELDRVLRVAPTRPATWEPEEGHELVLIYANGADLDKGKPVRFTDTLQSDVFTISQAAATRNMPTDQARAGERTGSKLNNLGRRAVGKLHPAAFPVALPEAFIVHLADVGAPVLDPFAGWGTTALAAHRTGRIGYALELSPKYVDAAVVRLQQATGELPRRNGRPLDLAKKLTPKEPKK